MQKRDHVEPLLVVRDALRALDWYQRALGAEVLVSYEHGEARRVSHAELQIGAARFSVTEEAPAWNSDAPPSLGGSPVVLQLDVPDVDAALALATGCGVEVVFPPVRLFGEHMARLRDPFGHLWLLRRCVEALTREEIQRQRDELLRQALQAAASAPAAAVPSPAVPTAAADTASAQQEATRPSPQSSRSVDPQAASMQEGRAGGVPRGRLVLLLGPVAAGKSTLALKLAAERRAVRLTLDEWMATLFRADRGDIGLDELPAWYAERAGRCHQQLWSTALSVLSAGVDVVAEIGLLRREQRAQFLGRVSEAAVQLEVFVLDAPAEVRWARVQRRNLEQGETFHAVITRDVFEFASAAWQPVDASEFEGVPVVFL